MSEQSTQPPAEGLNPEQAQRFQQQQQALAMLIGAVRMAQKRGAFTLEEAAIISPAVAVFAPPEQRPPNNMPGQATQAEKPEAETEE